MKLLLDTHVLLWAASGSGLSADVITLLNDQENELHFSAASIWEIAIKTSLGRPEFVVDAGVFRRELLESGYEEMAISGSHAAAVSSLPDLHKDPFDRILIAQAIVEGIALLSADAAVLAYPGPVRPAL
ncbi:type II toxin-antitoxin system VapC family toxin [Phenylobacterium sp.]|jgi:PIN domain nuclease of toxin-antitoxin system|uniref:type II toxin-antitoxin system VapC family toxin n=1 Tax=Phenylobacterium sp. TaxID=1871053 RepID=UPI002E2EAA95|nr:type II toxin-antitoxin system VapC family toxin [Phenylobacterium sp.]HEX4713029.1 type II toxin-antitoxin system VapC family toxin [Phenylobacterium sp.]